MSQYRFESRHESGRAVLGLAEASSEQALRDELARIGCELIDSSTMPTRKPTLLEKLTPSPTTTYNVEVERHGNPTGKTPNRTRPPGDGWWVNCVTVADETQVSRLLRWGRPYGLRKTDTLHYCAALPWLLPVPRHVTEEIRSIQVDRDLGRIHFRSRGVVLQQVVLAILCIVLIIVGGHLAQATRGMSLLWVLPLAFTVALAVILLGRTHRVLNVHSGMLSSWFGFPIPLITQTQPLASFDRLWVYVEHSSDYTNWRKQRFAHDIYTLGLYGAQGGVPLVRLSVFDPGGTLEALTRSMLERGRHTLMFGPHCQYMDGCARLSEYAPEVQKALRVLADLMRIDVIQIESGRTTLLTTLRPETTLPEPLRDEFARTREPLHDPDPQKKTSAIT